MRADTETGLNIAAGWRDIGTAWPDSVPSCVRDWIALDTSMTQALRRHVGMDVQIRLVRHGRGALSVDEAGLLQAHTGSGYVREVVLEAGGRALLAARTVHASPSLHCRLSSLGTRPLGEWLFAGGPPCRLRRQYALLAPGRPQFGLVRQASGASREPCWARRVLYLFEHQPLLVTEIFLAAMLQPSPAFLSVTTSGVQSR